MKLFAFLPALTILFFSFSTTNHDSKKNLQLKDSTIINHVLDGSTSEWPANRFEQNKSPNIRYALDNDAKNLYVAMIIPDFETQMKIMGQGMQLYIDTKGKKKEGKGIKFPQKKVQANYAATNQSGKPDMKLLKSLMAMNLGSLQLFGFSDEEQKDQDLMAPGSANIMFTWDDNNVMAIEYRIPVSLVGDITSLNQKQISFGWIINGAEIQQEQSKTPLYTESRIVAVPAGSRPPSQSTHNSSSGNSVDSYKSKSINEQSFWTKYTISIASK